MLPWISWCLHLWSQLFLTIQCKPVSFYLDYYILFHRVLLSYLDKIQEPYVLLIKYVHVISMSIRSLALIVIYYLVILKLKFMEINHIIKGGLNHSIVIIYYMIQGKIMDFLRQRLTSNPVILLTELYIIKRYFIGATL